MGRNKTTWEFFLDRPVARVRDQGIWYIVGLKIEGTNTETEKKLSRLTISTDLSGFSFVGTPSHPL